MSINEIFNLTPEEKSKIIEKIIDKVSINTNSSKKTRKTKWKDREFVSKVILDYVRILIVDRNLDITMPDAIITENEAFHILYTNFNFRNKPNPQKAIDVFKVLDKYMTREQANQIFKNFPKVTTMSLEELERKLDISSQYGYLNNVISDPKKLIGSSSWLSAKLAYRTNTVQKEIQTVKSLSDIKNAEEIKKKNFKEEIKVEVISPKSIILKKHDNRHNSFSNQERTEE